MIYINACRNYDKDNQLYFKMYIEDNKYNVEIILSAEEIEQYNTIQILDCLKMKIEEESNKLKGKES